MTPEIQTALERDGMVALEDGDAIRAFGIPQAEICDGKVVWPSHADMAASLVQMGGLRGYSVLGVNWMKAYPDQTTLGRIGAPYITPIPLSWLPLADQEKILEIARQSTKTL
jgi:hypothetical protein